MHDLGSENLKRAADFFDDAGDPRAARIFRDQLELRRDAGRVRRKHREGLIYSVVIAVAMVGAVWAIRMLLVMAGAR